MAGSEISMETSSETIQEAIMKAVKLGLWASDARDCGGVRDRAAA